MKKKLIFISLWVAVWALSLTVFKAQAQAPLLPLQEQPIETIVSHFAQVNDVDPRLMLKIMECESHGKQETKGDNGNATGIYQFWRETWNRHSKEFGEVLDINSPYDQAKLASWSIANGKAKEWTTYRAIMNGGTYTFYSKQLKRTYTVYCKLTDV